MGILWRTKVDFKKKAAQLDENTRKAIGQQVELAATEIVHRTLRGQGVGGAFPAYSESYKRVLKEAGENTSPVDLHRTGAMLDSVHSEVRERNGEIEGVVYISGGQIGDVSNAEKVRHLHAMKKNRKFFGFSSKQKQSILRALKGKLTKGL